MRGATTRKELAIALAVGTIVGAGAGLLLGNIAAGIGIGALVGFMVGNEPVDNTLLELGLAVALGFMMGSWLTGVVLGAALPFAIRPLLRRSARRDGGSADDGKQEAGSRG